MGVRAEVPAPTLRAKKANDLPREILETWTARLSWPFEGLQGRVLTPSDRWDDWAMRPHDLTESPENRDPPFGMHGRAASLLSIAVAPYAIPVRLSPPDFYPETQPSPVPAPATSSSRQRKPAKT